MPTPRVARARWLAEQLAGLGIQATADADKLLGQLPGVLIGPPVLTFDRADAATATWRLLAIASTTTQADAWTQLDELISQLADHLTVERAEPTAYARGPGSDPLPAYALTITDSVES